MNTDAGSHQNTHPKKADEKTCMHHITLAHQVQPNDDVLFQEVAGEAVLLNLASERYFGLDPVGTRIWGLLSTQANLQLVHQALCDTYDADPDKIQADLLALITQLCDAGLVSVRQ